MACGGAAEKNSRRRWMVKLLGTIMIHVKRGKNRGGVDSGGHGNK